MLTILHIFEISLFPIKWWKLLYVLKSTNITYSSYHCMHIVALKGSITCTSVIGAVTHAVQAKHNNSTEVNVIVSISESTQLWFSQCLRHLSYLPNGSHVQRSQRRETWWQAHSTWCICWSSFRWMSPQSFSRGGRDNRFLCRASWNPISATEIVEINRRR